MSRTTTPTTVPVMTSLKSSLTAKFVEEQQTIFCQKYIFTNFYYKIPFLRMTGDCKKQESTCDI